MGKMPLRKDKPIIKWHEYVMKRDEEKQEGVSEEASSEPVQEQQSEITDAVSVTGDADMDAEVARIMASFSGAKQNSVDSVIQTMNEQEELIRQIGGQKQAGVDFLVQQNGSGE